MGIGRKVELLIDRNRKEELGNTDDFRKIPISIFYPTDEETEGLYKDLYSPKEEILNRIYSEGSEIKKEYLDKIKLNIKNNAIKKDGNFPVVIFSHGLTADRDFFTFLYEDLVKSGFVVISVGHLYDTDLTLLPDGTEVVMKEGIDKDVSLDERRRQLLIRKDDVIFVKEQLDTINNLNGIDGIIDTTKVFIGGHSLGAITTLYAGLNLNDIKGCFAFDLPVHLIDLKYLNEFQDSKYLPFLNMYREFKNPDSLKLMNNIIQMKFLNPNEYTIMIKDADHMIFSDWYTIYPEKYHSTEEDRDNSYKLINDLVVSFLKDVLHGTLGYYNLITENKTGRIISKQ